MIQKIKDFLVVSVWGNIEKFFNTTVTRVHEIYDGILTMIKAVVSNHKILLWTILGVLILADLALGVRFGVVANIVLAIKGILEIVAVNLGAAVLVIIGVAAFMSLKK